MLGRDRCDSHGDEVAGEEDLGRAVARLEPARGQRAAGAARQHAPRGYIYASMMLLAGQVAAVPFVASIPSM